MLNESSASDLGRHWSALLASGSTPSPDILSSFVPMTDLSATHLASLSRVGKLIALHGSQFIGDQSVLNEYYLYLLSGDIVVNFGDCGQRVVYSAENFGSLSVGDFIDGVSELVAASDAQLLVVQRCELDSMLCWDQVAKSLSLELCAEREFDEDREWLSTLLTSNLFHRIPPYNIRHVVDRFVPRVVQTGEVIVREGQDGDECFIIKEGVASVSQMDEGLNEPVVLASLHAGQCFGDEALVRCTSRNASVTMESNGVLMVLKQADFNALLDEPAVEAIDVQGAEALVQAGDATWLDVRSQQEFDHDHRDNAFHLPLHLMSIKARLMNKKFRYLAYCSTGRRAATAARLLSRQGFDVIPVLASESH